MACAPDLESHDSHKVADDAVGLARRGSKEVDVAAENEGVSRRKCGAGRGRGNAGQGACMG